MHSKASSGSRDAAVYTKYRAIDDRRQRHVVKGFIYFLPNELTHSFQAAVFEARAMCAMI